MFLLWLIFGGPSRTVQSIALIAAKKILGVTSTAWWHEKTFWFLPLKLQVG